MAEHRRSCGVCGGSHLIYERCPISLAKEKQRNKEKNERYADESKFLKSTKWQKFRKRIINRDGGHCQRCLAFHNLIITESLEVHHMKPRSIYNGQNGYPDLRLEETNCITLCKQCNTHLGVKEELDFPFEFEKNEFYLG